ncbi:MAG TPA: TlyA family RNA methyltransferase [Ktedonobacterales bacterium]|nr:TlyA family RNA methyltransferase [Ktedonobacterales bacterium]
MLVVTRGLAPSRERAQAIIMAGQIRVNGQIASKPGMRVPGDASIELVAPPPELRYVSRGGLKLEHALDTLHLDPAGLSALDIGASTGGFTDVMLRRGADRIFAIDVGQGQLAWSLRSDPRVVVMERTNIRDVDHLPDNTLADCAVIDVSFISLRLVLPHVVRLLSEGAWIVALIKPQFEAGKREADRGSGVIRDPAVHRRVLDDLLRDIATNLPHLTSHDLIASPITGRDGNHEYLLWLDYATNEPVKRIDIEGVVRGSLTP